MGSLYCVFVCCTGQLLSIVVVVDLILNVGIVHCVDVCGLCKFLCL